MLRYVAQFLIVLSPLLSGAWSVLDTLGYEPDADGIISVAGIGLLTGPKQQVEFHLRAFVAAVLFALTLVNEAASVGLPLRRMQAFRQRFLDDTYDKQWKSLLGDGIRLNVMYLQHRPQWLWVPMFRWCWNKNFDPPNHRDANMRLLKWQGVAGAAVRAQEPKSAYFGPDAALPKPYVRPYYLGRSQLRRTAHLKGILSIPILRKVSTGSPEFMCVGVINIDAVTEEASARLRRNEKELATYFIEIGILLGDLSL